ncbi:YagK/YfjJ domain-containing protein [Photobacterium leiognathi]|uniref:YagK/YfjJ domain-containing protein n=1 Tax=Photobacterium leiognathi TaxID=553611 RepID=UPI00298195C6|nr:inovirus-type Gp2 protein [Photobacterium leiognathi]
MKKLIKTQHKAKAGGVSEYDCHAGYLYYYDGKRIETEHFIHQELIWQVIHFKDGINKKIMGKLIDLMQFALSTYSRILALRLDFKCYLESQDNKPISSFFNHLILKLKRRYGRGVYYAWVREQGKENQCPHYHAVILLNGHKVNHPSRIITLIQRDITQNPHISFYCPENCYYQIRRDSTADQQRFIYRASYLSKNKSKENKGKSFSISRMK